MVIIKMWRKVKFSVNLMFLEYAHLCTSEIVCDIHKEHIRYKLKILCSDCVEGYKLQNNFYLVYDVLSASNLKIVNKSIKVLCLGNL